MKRKSIFIILFLLTLLVSSSSTIQSSADESPVKNVIVMIGDGMGFEHVRFASYIEYGVENGLFMQSDSFYNTSMTTLNVDGDTTDSAASGTAISSGVKTHNKYLGLDADGNPVETILEYAEDLGKSTGLVTTSAFNHATPAAFASHVDNRDDWVAINEDMVNQGIEVILGGGDGSKPSQTSLDNNGYTEITTKTELETTTDNRLFGTFEAGHLKYEGELNYTTDVRISDMVPKALDLLKTDSDGFFLMVESARIDHAAHEYFEALNAQETIQFDYTIKYVMDFIADNPDTILIIVADHETGYLRINSASGLDSNLPDSSMTEEERRERRVERVGQMDVEIRSSAHSDFEVPLKLFGKNSDQLAQDKCEYTNSDVYGIMKNAYNGHYGLCPGETFSSENGFLTFPQITLFTSVLVTTIIYTRRRYLNPY